MDTLSSTVRCLLGARLKIYPFSVESGFFSYTSSSVSAKAKKCIFLVDPLWCTVNDSFLCISRRQNLNYVHFFRKLYPHSLNSQDFLHTINIISRRRSPKTTKTSSQNYEYTGHNLDTITACFFRLLVCHFLCFYYAKCAFWAQ